MTQTEWDELVQLRKEMNESLMALDAATQEKFVELLVKSLEGKGDLPVGAVSRSLRRGRSTL